MKNLAAIALAALVLTGCGVQTAPTAVLSKGAVAASAERHEIQLYGSWVQGKVLAAKRLTHRDEAGKTLVFQELTVHSTKRERPGDPHGPIVFRVTTGAPLAKVGQTVATFVNYTLIDSRTNTFVNKPGKPFWALELEIVN